MARFQKKLVEFSSSLFMKDRKQWRSKKYITVLHIICFNLYFSSLQSYAYFFSLLGPNIIGCCFSDVTLIGLSWKQILIRFFKMYYQKAERRRKTFGRTVFTKAKDK